MKCPKCHSENPDTQRFCGECGTQIFPEEKISGPPTETLETPREELTTGSTFAGRYQIIEELGKGGIGRVYKAHDIEIKEKVALKLLKPEVAVDKKTIERFRNELKFARKIAHRNVCKMYDLGEEKGTRYITMEYVPGEDLKSTIIRIGQLPIAKTISIAKQVCEGLAEAHRLGVIHRDLKPQNIMIDKEGNARLMDFGIARSVKGEGITGAGVMVGTPEYMSPEQVEGKEIDQRSDIYSLGVILYEMVTGKVPFEGDTPFVIGVKHKSEMPTAPKELNAQLPEDLNNLILKCLEKDKEKRYQSAGEVRSELASVQKEIPTIEREEIEKKPFAPEEIKEKGVKPKSKRAVLFGGSAVILILLIIIGFSLIPGRQEILDSIAVLPIENLYADPEQEYFSDGMTDALISELAKLSGFQRVISRQSVMQYKGSKKPMPEIARELNVDAVVEGTVLLVGERVRITAKLINARKDQNIWSDSYERYLKDVLVLQREMARAIAKKVKIAITQKEQSLLTQDRPVNPEAYQLYLKGWYFYKKWTEEALKKAIEYFKQAIKKDPGFALAYLGMASAYRTLADFGYPTKETYPKAKEAVLKVLAIDDTLVRAHVVLGWIKMNFEWDWVGAEREFKQAIEKSPGDSSAHNGYAFNSLYRGRFDEAIKEIKRAQELDPLSLTRNRDVGTVFFFAREYDQAKEAFLRAMELDPNFPFLHFYLGRTYLAESRYEESLLEFQKEMALSRGGNLAAVAFIAYTYLKMGNRSKALEIINDLEEGSKQTYIPPILFAGSYFALGDTDLGFKWLDNAYKERDFWLQWLKVDPVFDSIRSDSQYKAMVKKIGLDK